MAETAFPERYPLSLPASEVHDNLWQEIVDLNEQAVRARYPGHVLDNPFVQQSIGLDGWEQYADRQRDPQSQVGITLKPDQLIRNTWVTVMRRAAEISMGDLVAVVSSADNTSGRLKHLKMLTEPRWGWIRWVASSPDSHQPEATACTVKAAITNHSKRGSEEFQPLSAYIWPSRSAQRLFENLGFKPETSGWMPPDVDNLPLNVPLPAERFTKRRPVPKIP